MSAKRSPTRVRKGIPTGGQYATGERTEQEVALTSDNPSPDSSDWTTWDDPWRDAVLPVLDSILDQADALNGEADGAATEEIEALETAMSKAHKDFEESVDVAALAESLVKIQSEHLTPIAEKFRHHPMAASPDGEGFRRRLGDWIAGHGQVSALVRDLRSIKQAATQDLNDVLAGLGIPGAFSGSGGGGGLPPAGLPKSGSAARAPGSPLRLRRERDTCPGCGDSGRWNRRRGTVECPNGCVPQATNPVTATSSKSQENPS